MPWRRAVVVPHLKLPDEILEAGLHVGPLVEAAVDRDRLAGRGFRRRFHPFVTADVGGQLVEIVVRIFSGLRLQVAVELLVEFIDEVGLALGQFPVLESDAARHEFGGGRPCLGFPFVPSGNADDQRTETFGPFPLLFEKQAFAGAWAVPSSGRMPGVLSRVELFEP